MSSISSRRWAILAVTAATFCGLVGCGEDVGVELVPITGVVKLDSQPLANARVVFSPKNGRPSAGTTDAEGRYELFYTVDEPGVLPASHTISISTFIEPDSDSDDPARQKGQPESVPAIFNRKSTLTHEIEPEHSEPVNFELKSPTDGRTAAG
jgi:hypothetical protein